MSNKLKPNLLPFAASNPFLPTTSLSPLSLYRFSSLLSQCSALLSRPFLCRPTCIMSHPSSPEKPLVDHPYLSPPFLHVIFQFWDGWAIMSLGNVELYWPSTTLLVLLGVSVTNNLFELSYFSKLLSVQRSGQFSRFLPVQIVLTDSKGHPVFVSQLNRRHNRFWLNSRSNLIFKALLKI